MNLYISVGRVSEALLMLSAVQRYQCHDVSSSMQLSVVYGINKAEALDFAEQCGLITIQSHIISFTPDGVSIMSKFNNDSLSHEVWRLMLKMYILRSRPSWASLIPSGRKEAYIFMSNDEKRCFVEAGLMDVPNHDIVVWWDEISSYVRKNQDESLLANGRLGEELTIEYEKKRTGALPLWQSIDSNKTGFDIISIKDRNNSNPIYIEVKCSTKGMREASFFITRHEWEIASVSNSISEHLFYLWSVIDKQYRLAILTIENLRIHLPIDMGEGRWTEANLKFDLFEELFFDYDYIR